MKIATLKKHPVNENKKVINSQKMEGAAKASYLWLSVEVFDKLTLTAFA